MNQHHFAGRLARRAVRPDQNVNSRFCFEDAPLRGRPVKRAPEVGRDGLNVAFRKRGTNGGMKASQAAMI